MVVAQWLTESYFGTIVNINVHTLWIQVLMLTLSNDPPTLDRESTKHRYSKLLKEMIDTCLQKDPTRRLGPFFFYFRGRWLMIALSTHTVRLLLWIH